MFVVLKRYSFTRYIKEIKYHKQVNGANIQIKAF